jgi:hypothetical protein
MRVTSSGAFEQHLNRAETGKKRSIEMELLVKGLMVASLLLSLCLRFAFVSE